MLKDKVAAAVSLLRSFEPKEGYYLAFSGGKDSQVVYHLAKLAEVKFDAHYNFTTVDPPELVRFVKSSYAEVSVDMPRSTMWQLIVNNKMPPTRWLRYCCKRLKEVGGIKRYNITGVRWEESANRRNKRALIETNACSRSLKHDTIMFFNENSYENKLKVNSCKILTKHIINPIINWTEADVWDFISWTKLSYCKLYDEGFSRIGCVGCPLLGRKGMLRDFDRWPNFRKAYIKAFSKMLDARKAGLSKKDDWQTAEEVFEWWLGK